MIYVQLLLLHECLLGDPRQPVSGANDHGKAWLPTFIIYHSILASQVQQEILSTLLLLFKEFLAL